MPVSARLGIPTPQPTRHLAPKSRDRCSGLQLPPRPAGCAVCGRAACPAPPLQQARGEAAAAAGHAPPAATTALPRSPACASDATLELYTSQAYGHRRLVGPVVLDRVQGKGLGLRAARDLAPGELLLCSLPLAILYGPPGEPPSNEELASELLRAQQQRLEPLELAWLQLLLDCSDSGGGGVAARQGGVAGGAADAAGEAAVVLTDAGGARVAPGQLLARARALLAQSAGVGGGAAAEEARLTAPSSGADAVVGGQHAPSFSASAAAPISIVSLHATAAAAGPLCLAAAPAGVAAVAAAASAAGLVRRYSYAEAREDPALIELLDVAPVSCAGLWPEAALINHSCCPNASVLVVGSAMYVRAARPVLEGEEVTVSYLAQGLFQHAAERRALLRASHGFICCCPRCIMEHTHFPTRRYPELEAQQRKLQEQQRSRLQRRLQGAQPEEASPAADALAVEGGDGGDIDDAAHEFPDDAQLASSLLGKRAHGPLQALLDWVFGAGRFSTAIAPDRKLLHELNAVLDAELRAAAQAALTAPSRPRQQTAALQARLAGCVQQVEAACEELDLPPRSRLLVLASVYGVLRLAVELSDMTALTDPNPQRRLQLAALAADVLEAAAPGSDAHVAAAVRAAGLARRVHGPDSVEARRAELASGRAHVVRYGRGLLAGAGPRLLRRMADARRRLGAGNGVGGQLGVLAWAAEVEGRT